MTSVLMTNVTCARCGASYFSTHYIGSSTAGIVYGVCPACVAIETAQKLSEQLRAAEAKARDLRAAYPADRKALADLHAKAASGGGLVPNEMIPRGE